MRRKIAFLVSRFPKISETFILDEILDLRRRGLDIEIFSLLKEKESKIHREAGHLTSQVHYALFLTRAFWSAQIYWLSRHPSVYVRSWWKAISGNLFSLTFLLRALFIVPAAAYFARLMKAHGIDHVHAHWATHPALAAYVIRVLAEIPYSITAHAHDIYVNRSMLKEKLAAADFVVTISEYNRKMLSRYGSDIAEKIHVIHCGIDPDRFRDEHPVRRNRDPFTILCIASLSDYKGHRYLVDACASLKEHGVSLRCLFAGEGPERKKLESQIARLDLKEEIRLLGWQDREEIYALMKEADVFALPSVVTKSGKQEGIPVALMEAMALEIPVVATSISGVPELVEHGQTGLLVPEKNAAALAAAIYLIYSHPRSAREMAGTGKSKVVNEFNLHVNTGRLFRMLSGLEPQHPTQNFKANLEFWQNERGRAC